MICNIEDIAVYYEAYGEGVPILMIHGYTPDHRLMTGCMEPIFARLSGWKRIYLDLPGMGKTPARKWIVNSDVMLEIILKFVEQVLPRQNFLVAGESYGGYLARGIVYKIPQRVDGLCLICPAVEPDADKRDLPEGRVILRDESIFDGVPGDEAEEFRPMAVMQNRKNLERFRTEIMPGLRLADMAFLNPFRASGYSFTFDVDALAQPFDKPTLILNGRQDTSTGYRDAWRILENYPRGTFVVLDSAGHNLQIEQEGLFTALVMEWLERVGAA